MTDMLQKAYRGGWAVGGFDAPEAISALASIEAGQALGSPILLICAPTEYQTLGARGVVAVVRALAGLAGAEVALHLDHTPHFGEVVEAVEAGFTSVMIDGSTLSYEENLRLTRRVADYAHARGVTVEAELGHVGRVDDQTHEGGGAPAGAAVTDARQAAEFARASGCDYLAVAIGNAHGLYPTLPRLDMDALARIREAVPIPLVLHGGSGTPEDQLRKAVSLGIAKVNVASEIMKAFNQVYLPRMGGGKTWWALAQNEAKAAMRAVTERWIGMLGSAGKA